MDEATARQKFQEACGISDEELNKVLQSRPYLLDRIIEGAQYKIIAEVTDIFCFHSTCLC